MKIVNITPKALSGESHQDSGASIAVNPKNPNEIVISALTPNPNGGGMAPVYVSVDGGNTWSLKEIIPGNGPTGTTGITLKYGSGSNELYTAITKGTDPYTLDILRTSFPVLGLPMEELDSPLIAVQQPYVAAATVPDGPDAGKDRLYVGINVLPAPLEGDGQTSTIRQTMHAQIASPAFANISIDSRSKNSGPFQDLQPPRNGPQVRPVAHPDGTVYAVFYSWRSWEDLGDGNGLVKSDVVIVRDDAWGQTANPYNSLIDSSDDQAGQRIATNVQLQFYATLGQERIGGDLAIAIDPANSSIVYVAWSELELGANGDRTNRLHLRRSVDKGQTWSRSDLLTIHNGKNPGLAVNGKGQLGFLYQQLTGAAAKSQRWETHLAFTQDAINWNNMILANVSATIPARQFLPYLGDYADLMTVGNDFYGVFCANNQPTMAHFPLGVTYQRNHDFNSKVLLGLDGKTHVAISIDPFFFTTAFVPPTVKIPWQEFASTVIILFGIIQDGGGAYLDQQGHIHIVGPGDPGPLFTYLISLAQYRLATATDDTAGLEMQKLALQRIVDLANAQIALIDKNQIT